MIKVRNLVPEVYYNESRDFQTIGRVYEAVFNYLKTNADIMASLPASAGSDWHMLKLMAATLGFQGRREYDNNELRALCMSLIPILRLKGSKSSIALAVNTMLNAHGIDEVPTVLADPKDPFNYLIYISERLTDTSLLEDLMDYILPAGFTYRLIDARAGKTYQGADVVYSDSVRHYEYSTESFSDKAMLGNIATEATAKDASFDAVGSGDTLSLVSGNTIITPKEKSNDGQ